MIEWQQNPPKKPMTWHESMEYAESLGNGWRLPTRAELIDAYDNKIEDFDFSYYWSSSTYAQGTSNAWLVNFNYGLCTTMLSLAASTVFVVFEK